MVALHTDGRRALLHRDGVNGRLLRHASARASPPCSPAARSPTPPTTRCAWSRRARSSARSTRTGPSSRNGGDIFQLGNASWRDPPRRAGRRARGRRQGPAAHAPLLAGRGARPHARAVGGDRRPARGLRRGAADGAGLPARRVRARAARGRRHADRRLRRGGPPGAWARCPRRSASSSSASSTRAAACSSWCTRRSARASTGPGAWPCASVLRRASASSCRRRPTRRPSSSRSARSTASRWRTSSTTSTPTTAREVLVQALLAGAACSRRAGAGTPSARCCSSARATARGCRRALLRMRADDLLAAAFPQARGLPRDAARRARSRCRWTTRSCGRRSRTA